MLRRHRWIKLSVATLAVATLLAIAWVATAPLADVQSFNHLKARWATAEYVAQNDDLATRNGIGRTRIHLNDAVCSTDQHGPVLGWAQYDRHNEGYAICVSHWQRSDAQRLIVFAHELGHVVENLRRQNQPLGHGDGHDLRHYRTTARVLTETLHAAEMSPADRLRVKLYYGAGTAVSPFTGNF